VKKSRSRPGDQTRGTQPRLGMDESGLQLGRGGGGAGGGEGGGGGKGGGEWGSRAVGFQGVGE